MVTVGSATVGSATVGGAAVRLAMLSHMHHPIAEPFQGGTEAHTSMLADALVRRGHDVTLFAKEGSESSASIYPLVPKDFEFVRTASPLVRKQQQGFLAEAVHHSISVIRTLEFDAVVNNSLSSLPFAFMRDVPMMTILHTPPTLADVTAIVTDPSWSASSHHAYVTVSETNATAWRSLLPSVVAIPNGIHLDRWANDIPSRPGVAVWAARITPEKGLDVAIDAARRAGMQLEFAGPISHSDYFDSEIVPRLGPDVRYRGHLSHAELPAFFASGAVFVASPIWAEPFGLSVVEALASGTPVAALPNGALPELIGPGFGSVALDVSAEALAHAMTDAALCDPHDVIRAAARFSFEDMVDAYEHVLESVVPSYAAELTGQ